ncbi:ABC transporter permease subunit [Aeromicrobium halocynthiae]|uniref:ABC transporter permease subunit n=1 Tax=Aeromicrobium halocynthiae TaxID=560557 RepID=A0ABP5HR38_9ACTN
MTWAWDNRSIVIDLFLVHAWLSIVPIVVGFVLAVPVGWYASRHPRLRGVLLSGGSILYTIPSLPLFVLLPGIIGTGFLDPLNVIIALSIYAFAIMVRTAADAFTAVSPAVLDAATATGYSSAQRGFLVELPLAGPVLLAGVRVVSVSTISLVTVGALIGVRNLGSLFTSGYRRDFTTEILVGVVAVVLLALLLDALLVLLGRVLMPWSVDGPGAVGRLWQRLSGRGTERASDVAAAGGRS